LTNGPYNSVRTNVLHCDLHPHDTVTHLDFRRTIAVSLLKAQPRRIRLGGPTTPTVIAVRYDGVNHHLASFAQGRCVLCQRNTRLQCIKCRKRLHKHCSNFYHTKWLTLTLDYCMFMTYLFDFTCFATVVLEVMAHLNISLKQLVVILLIGPKVLLCVMNYSAANWFLS